MTESFGWPLSQASPHVAKTLKVIGSRPIRILNQATNLLARVTATAYGAGRHFSRADRKAFLLPYRNRRVRAAIPSMLRDAGTAEEYLLGVDEALRTSLAGLPMLAIFGGKSPSAKAGFPEGWLERFPDARIVIIDGGHHFPMTDDPATVAGAIRSFSNAPSSPARPGLARG